MSDMKSNLLWQLMQSMGMGGLEEIQSDAPEVNPSHVTLDPPWDTILMLRPMLSPREQRIIDLMFKLQEVKKLFEEIQKDNRL